MKQKSVIYFLAVIVLLMASFDAAAKPPKWAKKLPTTSNTTFQYYVAKSEGRSFDEARAKAYQIVKRNIAESMGMATDVSVSGKTSIDPSNGTMKVESKDEVGGNSSINVPMRMVCEAEEQLKNGTYRVYQLYQIAIAGNMQVLFDTFSNCN
jgi:hypothetical protein